MTWMTEISQKFPDRRIEIIDFHPLTEDRWKGVIRTTIDGHGKEFLEFLRSRKDLHDIRGMRCDEECSTEKDKSFCCYLSFECSRPDFVDGKRMLKMPIILEKGKVILDRI